MAPNHTVCVYTINILKTEYFRVKGNAMKLKRRFLIFLEVLAFNEGRKTLWSRLCEYNTPHKHYFLIIFLFFIQLLLWEGACNHDFYTHTQYGDGGVGK